MSEQDDFSHRPMRGEATRILAAINRGETDASDRLLPLVYEELRRLAQARLGRESPGQTLQPTALVHEAYLRLVGEKNAQWQNHAQFFAAAAVAMRRILIERARRKKTSRRALGVRQDAAELQSGSNPESIDLLALDAALEKLARMDARLSEIVHLRFFAGLSVEQTASVTGLSERTVKRDWNFARAWLHNEMSEEPGRDRGG